MNTYVKWGLGIGAVVIGLKVISDASKYSAELRARGNTATNVNQVGGKILPTAIVTDASPSKGPVNTETGLPNTNPDTGYGEGYFA